MSKGKSIAQWVQGQGEKLAGVRVQLGNRSTGTSVGIVEVEGRGLDMSGPTVPYSCPIAPLPQFLEELALDAGWGGELGREPVLKLYSLDKKGKAITTFQRTARKPVAAGQVTDIHALAMEHRRAMDKALDTICEQARTNTRTIDILTETLAHRESMMAHALEAFMDSSQDAIEQKAINAMLETALDGGQQEDSLKTVQGQVLQSVMGLLGGQTADEQADEQEMTAEQIYKAMSENPMLRFDVGKLFETESKPAEEA